MDEPILSDDYPMYPHYLYVMDDVVQFCEASDITTVGTYKKKTGIKEIRRCDIIRRFSK